MTKKLAVGQVVNFPEVKHEIGLYTVIGDTLKIGEILYEYYREDNGEIVYADVEFKDTLGYYHHYKSNYDGPYIIKTTS